MASNYFGDYDLQDWAAAGLPQQSRAKGNLDTLARSTILRTLGRLSQRDLDGIKASVRLILEL
jgi:hypothetical protein